MMTYLNNIIIILIENYKNYMEELTNLFKKNVNIKEPISKKILKLVSDDFDRITDQMISDNHNNTKIYIRIFYS